MLKIERVKKSLFLKSVLVTTLGSSISKVILVLATFYCTRNLCKEDFGIFSFIRNTLNIILCICALNYSGLCTKFTAESAKKKSSSYKLVLLILFSLVVCLLFGGGLIFLPVDYILTFFPSKELLGYFYIIGFLLPIFMLQPLVEGILRGHNAFNLVGKLQITSSLLFLFLIIVGLWWDNLNGAICAMLVYYTIYAMMSLYYLRKFINFSSILNLKIKKIWQQWPVLYKIIFPVFILSFIEAPINWWAQVILAQHGSFSAVGSMSAILQIRNLAILIPTYYFSTFISFASSSNAEKNMKDYFYKFVVSGKITFFVSLLVVALFCVTGDILLGFYGDSYKKDVIPFIYAMLGYPFLIIANLFKINLLVREHQRLMLFISVSSSFIFILSLYLFLLMDINAVSSFFLAQLAQSISLSILSFVRFIADARKEKINIINL